jgi:hypothetical protein
MSTPIDYDEATKERMKTFADRLSEIDLRAYAAVEAYKLGRGGVGFIAELFEMSPETIKKGQRDLDDPSRLPSHSRQRKIGAGRKGVLVEQPGLDDAFKAAIQSHTAGDPMNADIKWTDLQPSQIVTRLSDQGFELSENTVRSLLENKISGREVQ